MLVGMCEGQKLIIDMPAELGPEDVRAPAGARLRYEMEVMITLRIGGDKLPIKPNLFRVIDADGDRALDETELRNHFERIGKQMPAGVLDAEDKDKDGKIQWEEVPDARRTQPPKMQPA